MREHQASRTLLKSPPELWAECSDAQSLARHLDDFGEIRITRLEPEQAVAWEGERVSGTVRLEPAGWGTKVTLTASAASVLPATTAPASPGLERAPVQAPSRQPEQAPAPQPEPESQEPTPQPVRVGLMGRLRQFLAGPVPSEPTPRSKPPDPVPHATAPPPPPDPIAEATASSLPLPPSPGPSATQPEPTRAEAALGAALESLGKAHHRPFSRG